VTVSEFSSMKSYNEKLTFPGELSY